MYCMALSSSVVHLVAETTAVMYLAASQHSYSQHPKQAQQHQPLCLWKLADPALFQQEVRVKAIALSLGELNVAASLHAQNMTRRAIAAPEAEWAERSLLLAVSDNHALLTVQPHYTVCSH